jgi:hypothetical protein
MNGKTPLLHSKRAPLKTKASPEVTLIIVFNDFSFIKVMSNEWSYYICCDFSSGLFIKVVIRNSHPILNTSIVYKHIQVAVIF